MLYHIENPHGGDLYSAPIALDFSANINPLGTPPAVKEAVYEAASLLHQYPDPYCRELVAAISQYEQVPQDQILCGNGAAELIFSYCNALSPKQACVLAPTFSEYETALRSCGCEVTYYPLSESDNFALTDRFLPWLQQFPGDLLMLCNPNNPTGQVIAPALMDAISRICEEKGIYFFVDECFLDLTEFGDSFSLKTKLSRYKNLLLLKAFTKSYGMAGARLGYCLSGNPELLQSMAATAQPWNVSILAQKAGVAAFQQQDFLQAARTIIHTQRPILMGALQSLGFRVIPSRVNYILFHSPMELKVPLLAHGIQIRSCANYPGLGDGWYRIAVKRPEENQRLIETIKICLPLPALDT